ncbi:unnamed protein product [Effrenium voratum]|nr:unnamed protein product [Effrenium voratum]
MDSLSQLPGAALCRILSFATAVDWARSATAHRHLRLDVDCLLAESGLAETRSLGEAARRGDVNVVLARLRQGADPNQRDSQHPKYTPLHRATSGGHRALVRLLLKEKADVLLRDRLGFSALHFAANQSLGIVGDLLEARADVNAANLQQMTPLHSAAGMGRVDLCELLLQAGALGSAAAAASPAELARRAALRRPGEKREELLGLAEQLAELGETKAACWLYESEPLSEQPRDAQWLPFQAESSERLEAAYTKGEEEVQIGTSRSTYLVNLREGVQTNLVTGCCRRVRREREVKAWVPAAPNHWPGLVSTGANRPPL